MAMTIRTQKLDIALEIPKVFGSIEIILPVNSVLDI